MTHLTISETGLALIILESQIEDNLKELYRWQNRQRECEAKVIEARNRLNKNMDLLKRAKGNLK